jgi:heme/copper-type cytochrome/quinol oxidase subunit 2
MVTKLGHITWPGEPPAEQWEGAVIAMPRMPRRRSRALALAVGSLALAGALWNVTDAREQGKVVEVSVDGDHFVFSPARIEVQKDDLVKITFRAHDIAHSFTVDAYRIAKRAAAGQSVVFEFRADQTGSFPYYCNLSIDDKCKQMKGEIIVR